jgi:hypothetical protein
MQQRAKERKAQLAFLASMRRGGIANNQPRRAITRLQKQLLKCRLVFESLVTMMIVGCLLALIFLVKDSISFPTWILTLIIGASISTLWWMSFYNLNMEFDASTKVR